MGFKENLRDEITYQGLLVKEVASRAGLNAGSLSNYLKENSSIPAADVAVKIAKALGVTVEYLVSGQNRTTDNAQPYSPEVRRLADKLESMSERDRKNVSALIDSICETAFPCLASTTPAPFQ